MNIRSFGEIPNVEISNSVITDTYLRGIKLTGAKKVKIYNNVLYNIDGAGLSTSAADETDNIIEDNTIALTRHTNYGTNIYQNPSGIVIHSPLNIIKGNRVASSSLYGYQLQFDDGC